MIITLRAMFTELRSVRMHAEHQFNLCKVPLTQRHLLQITWRYHYFRVLLDRLAPTVYDLAEAGLLHSLLPCRSANGQYSSYGLLLY